MSLILSGTDGLSDVDGSAATPAIRGTDANTGIFFPAADTIAFSEGGVESMRIDSVGNFILKTGAAVSTGSLDSPFFYRISGGGLSINANPESGGGPVTFSTGNTERMRIDSAGRVGVGTTSPSYRLEVRDTADAVIALVKSGANSLRFLSTSSGGVINQVDNNPLAFYTNNAERARIDSSGNLLVGKTSADATTVGAEMRPIGLGVFTRDSNEPLIVNRLTNDGALVVFLQASVQEGTISVSGTTVSYNGGHLSRWAQTTTAKDESLVKGTVLSNLDEMNAYTDVDGNPVENEQLNKVKVSDVEGDANVAGVFVNWTHDDAHNVDEINMAMTGDMIIRIAQGVTVARGDLLMSAGDGTAKPQGDDIVRSKTVAKVTSTHVTCTYADGSYCVPCVLMAC